jgi:NhaP-type Na+/H+ or K+/H+ antiporter
VVVAFSILVQGLTMPWLIRRMGLGGMQAKSAAVAAQPSHP